MELDTQELPGELCFSISQPVFTPTAHILKSRSLNVSHAGLFVFMAPGPATLASPGHSYKCRLSCCVLGLLNVIPVHTKCKESV